MRVHRTCTIGVVRHSQCRVAVTTPATQRCVQQYLRLCTSHDSVLLHTHMYIRLNICDAIDAKRCLRGVRLFSQKRHTHALTHNDNTNKTALRMISSYVVVPNRHTHTQTDTSQHTESHTHTQRCSRKHHTFTPYSGAR